MRHFKGVEEEPSEIDGENEATPTQPNVPSQPEVSVPQQSVPQSSSSASSSSASSDDSSNRVEDGPGFTTYYPEDFE